MTQGFSIYFAPDDMPELLEFCRWKAAKVAGNFTSIESDFDLKEASWLIHQHRLQEQTRRNAQARQAEVSAVVAQQRESVGTLPDYQAQRELRDMQAAKEGEQQGLEYAKEK